MPTSSTGSIVSNEISSAGATSTAICSLKTPSRFCLEEDDPDSGFSVAIEPDNSDVEDLITDGLNSPERSIVKASRPRFGIT